METKRLQLHNVIADNNTRRLHYFAGRYLSEQEFDLMQQYVDERCEDLLRSAPPGIVYGLDVSITETDESIDISVRPGLGVGGDGRAVHVNFPIRLDWGSLIDEYKNRITLEGQEAVSVEGYYFLTVKRQIALLDESEGADPCSRTEPNPLRDSRLETFATLDLHFVSKAASWMAMGKNRVAMRVLVRSLSESPFDPDTGAVPVCLLKIVDDQLQWVEDRVGRLDATEENVYQNILGYWQSVQGQLRHEHAEGETLDNLAAITGVDYLPAAGPFPRDLMTDIAGRESEEDNSLWQRPILHFNPRDLQMELIAVPANSVDGIIQNELTRGVIDLVHNQQDRIRIMVAVEPDDYRADLLDLPDIDMALLNELHERYVQAASDYNAWAIEYFLLYGNITKTPVDLVEEDKVSVLKQIYKVAGPVVDYFDLTEEERRLAGLPVSQPAPQTTLKYFSEVVSERSSQLQDPQILPRPYSAISARISSEKWNEIFSTPPEPEYPKKRDADGLYRQRENLVYEMQTIEDFLIRSAELIDEVSDFMLLQRQQLDSITVSFAGLASGVIGDGSGLNLMRWSDSIDYQAFIEPDPQ